MREFRERFYDTKLFFDRFAHGKFARPLFARHEAGPVEGADAVRELVEETQLFIDASHACQIRVAESAQARGGGMSLQRVSVAVPFVGDVDPEAFVPVFHDWIRRGAVEGLLIDVARYGHVHHGPGIMLVGHEGDYASTCSAAVPRCATRSSGTCRALRGSSSPGRCAA